VCGTPLPKSDVSRREARRTVTVLLCDATVSTTEGSAVDPERSHRLLERFFDDARHAIERNGGVATDGPGDAVQGVFGLPEMLEDDAARAIGAAVDAMASASAMTHQLSDQGLVVDAWIGINSGEAVADPDNPSSVSGDPVSVALQLEETARPGEILVGTVTLRLVGDLVQSEPVEPIVVQGLSRPVPAFRVTSVRAGRADSARTPLFGRERDIAMLTDTFDRAIDKRAPHLVTLLGQAGIGKSRLVSEFAGVVGQHGRVLRGSCAPHGHSTTYAAVAEMIRHAAGIKSDDIRTKARTKLASLLGDEDDSAEISQRLEEVIEIVDAKSPPEEIFWAVRSLLERIAENDPLVVVFDGLQNADRTLIDLIEHIIEWTANVPILLIGVARPEFLEKNTTWGGGMLNATTISLEPLGANDITKLAQSLFGEGRIGDQVADRVVHATGGNPLFVEQVVSMLVDAKMVELKDGEWAPTSDLQRIPTSITALLGARLDSLGESERRVLEAAAVIGNEFPVSLVARAVERSEIAADIRSLTRKELIRRAGSGELGHEYSFRDGLMREVTYGSLLRPERARLHESVATKLQEDGAASPGQEMALGFHLEQAFLALSGLGGDRAHLLSVGKAAGERLAKLGRSALARADMPTASDLLSRAVAVMETDDPARVELALDLSVALLEHGELAAAKSSLRGISDLFHNEDVAMRVAVISLRSALSAGDTEGWADRAAALAEDAIRVFEKTQNHLGLAESYELWGASHWRENRSENAGAMYRRAHEHAQKAGAEMLEAKLIGFMASAAFWGTTPAGEGARLCEGILTDPDQNRLATAKVLSFLAGFKAMLGDFVRARRLIQESREIARDLGLRLYLAHSVQIPGIIEMLDGNYAQAEQDLLAGYNELKEMGERAHIPRAALDVAGAILAQGRLDDAEKLTQEARDEAAEDDIDAQVLWRIVLGSITARRGEAEAGQRFGREAVELASRTDNLFMHANAQVALGEVLSAAGKPDEARQAFTDALELYKAKGVVPAVDRTEKLLASLPA
jgi:class 3 adenylate cyclase/tetratricopeptide (TPR) repeat protein